MLSLDKRFIPSVDPEPADNPLPAEYNELAHEITSRPMKFPYVILHPLKPIGHEKPFTSRIACDTPHGPKVVLLWSSHAADS